MENKNENNCRTYDVLMVTRRPDALTTPRPEGCHRFDSSFSFINQAENSPSDFYQCHS